MIGTLLNGRFRLEERIGSGGMSTVYRAFDETLERWVAIKVMHREISGDAQQLERFRREARAVARLSHPHVVTIIDFGEDENRPYIVFEYVEGETLKERIKHSGKLPVGEATAYAIEIGRALSAAHAERLVHRDVKPQNVLIDAEGRAKVTDFGIARSLESEGLTATGRVLGTTDYVSPEQALGEDVTQQSDIYSLGICLYEMLTGDVPFKADTQVAVAMKHVRDRLPDVQRNRPEVSAALASIVERATSKETKNRYASIEEMLHDLEQALAIEVARAGDVSGEATTVLRALSGDTAEFAPLRLRRPGRVALLTVLGLLLAAGAVAAIVTRGEKGTTPNVSPSKVGRLTPVKLTADAVEDFDPPPGDGKEHPEQLRNAIDANRATSWETENYRGGLAGSGKRGVGVVIRPPGPVAARKLALITQHPGWDAQVYASNEAPPDLAGWGRPVGSATQVKEEEQIDLDTAGQRFGSYLLWVTKLPEGGRAGILELTLLR